MTPRIDPLWKPRDCYTVTDTLDAVERLTGKLNVAAGFQAWHRPVTMLDRISGKKVMFPKMRPDPAGPLQAGK